MVQQCERGKLKLHKIPMGGPRQRGVTVEGGRKRQELVHVARAAEDYRLSTTFAATRSDIRQIFLLLYKRDMRDSSLRNKIISNVFRVYYKYSVPTFMTWGTR